MSARRGTLDGVHFSEGSLAGRAVALWRADPDVGVTLRVRFNLRAMVLNLLFVATALVVIIASR